MRASPVRRLFDWLTTLVLVSVVSVAIWGWAAAETRLQRSFNVDLYFHVDSHDEWIVTPPQQGVKVDAEGSTLSMQELDGRMKDGFRLTIQPQLGEQPTDLFRALSELPEIRETGVRLIAVEPAVLNLAADQVQRLAVPIRVVNLEGVQTRDAVVVEPAQAVVAVPSSMAGRAKNLFVEAVVDSESLRSVEPGAAQTLSASLQLPEPLRGSLLRIVEPAPATARVSFTLRSRTESHTLSRVYVQLAGPAEDQSEYVVEFLDKEFNDVTITADADLIRRIRSDEVKVFAFVHLLSQEKFAGIDRKAASFMAVLPDGTFTPVEGRVGGAAPAVARLKITRRNPGGN